MNYQKILAHLLIKISRHLLFLHGFTWYDLTYSLALIILGDQSVSGHVVQAKCEGVSRDVSRQFASIRHWTDLIDRAWENAVQGQGKVWWVPPEVLRGPSLNGVRWSKTSGRLMSPTVQLDRVFCNMTVLNFRNFIAINFKKMTAAGILLSEQSFWFSPFLKNMFNFNFKRLVFILHGGWKWATVSCRFIHFVWIVGY